MFFNVVLYIVSVVSRKKMRITTDNENLKNVLNCNKNNVIQKKKKKN